MKHKATGNRGGMLGTALLFVLVLVLLVLSTVNLARGTAEEGVAATRSAIEKAAVLCYACEGFYPPGLAYLEEHYGVQVDSSRYTVRYEIFAANVAPVVRVIAR